MKTFCLSPAAADRRHIFTLNLRVLSPSCCLSLRPLPRHPSFKVLCFILSAAVGEVTHGGSFSG